MNLGVLGIFGLAALTMVVMVRGQARNRRFADDLARVLEEIFEPTAVEYKNIGGVVGQHFTYQLTAPYSTVQGTMTFFPRHTLLYYPVARFLRREDELRLLLRGEFSPRGEAHVVSKAAFRHGWVHVENADEMEQREMTIEGDAHLALFYNPRVADALIDLLRGVPTPEDLRHLACYGAEDVYYLHIEPHLETLRPMLRTLLERLPEAAGRA